MTETIDCVVDCRCTLGEGFVWDETAGRLWWTDIPARRIWSLDRASGQTRTFELPGEVGSFGLCEGSDSLVVAMADGAYLYDPASGGIERIVDPEPDQPTNRLNDGKIGPDGAFWVGSMDDRPLSEKEPVGALYRITADGGCEKKVDGVIVSNGIGWTGDGRTMFHSDSRGKWIDRWDCDPATGAISNRVRIAELQDAEGRPDGAAVDVEGCYWSAGVSAGCLNRFDRDGKLLDKVPVPVPTPTMCCFGDADMQTLFITSLKVNVPDEVLARHPWTGSVLAMRAPVAGVPTWRFKL
jgi:sugar lactone lactonase YvrE